MLSFRDEEEEDDDDQSTDGFDRLPDSLILLIFNWVSDVRSLIRCMAVSRRFNSLVPHSDRLCLRVDRVISAMETDDDGGDSFLVTIFRSIFKSVQELVSPKSLPGGPARSQNSPSRILRGFERIRELEIELPSGDLRPEKGAAIRWRAEFGRTLRSCVILGFRGGGVVGEGGSGGGGRVAELVGGGLRTRVVWTISALIAASARHYMLKEVVREHEGLERLVVRDRDGEGVVAMEAVGLREYRHSTAEEEAEPQIGGGGGVWWRNSRTTVPAVRMRMRHEPHLELSGGVRMEGATLVVVRTTAEGGDAAAEERGGGGGEAELAAGAFEGVHGEAVERLLKGRSYLLEMNSF